MNNSKPGNKLDGLLKLAVAVVYDHDPARYKNLIRWVWWCQKQGWPDEVIEKTLQLAGPKLHTVDNWWAYLSRLLSLASGRAHEDEAARYKRDELNFFNLLLGPDWAKKREERSRK